MKYPNKLRDIRKKVAANANDLADLLGVSFQHYYALERGERQLSATQIAKLSSYLKVTMDEIISYQPAPNSQDILKNSQDNEILGKNHKMLHLIARANNLPEHNQDNITKALEALIKAYEDNEKK